MSETLKELIKPIVLIQKVIWLALVGSMVFYIAFAYLFLSGNKALTSNVNQGIYIIPYIIAGAAAVVSIWYYRRAFSDVRLRGMLSKEPDLEKLATDFRTKKVDNNRLYKLKELDSFEVRAYSLMFELQKVTMICLVINETIIVAGLALAFITNDPSKIIPFGAAALVLSLWMFPKAQSLIDRVGKLISTS